MVFSTPLIFVLLRRHLAAFFSSYSVYVALEIAAVYKLGKDVLHKGRYSTGIESEPVLEFLKQSLRKNHITDTQ